MFARNRSSESREASDNFGWKSPNSSPTGPTGCTSVKKLAASEKWTAEPPSARSRAPKGVSIASNAIDPTTVTDMRSGRLEEGIGSSSHASRADRGVRRARGAPGRGPAEARAGGRTGADRGVARGDELRGHPPAREHLPCALRGADGPRRRGGGHDP